MSAKDIRDNLQIVIDKECPCGEKNNSIDNENTRVDNNII